MNHRKLRASGFLIAVGLSLGIGIGTLRAADVPPPTYPLFYSGTLTEGGQPVNDSRELEVGLWKHESSKDESARSCRAPANGAHTQITAGRFRVELPHECVTAVHDEPDQWVEVRVGGILIGNERVKLGAVPYALEAASASSAAGDLKEHIEALEAKSGFRASTAAAQNISGDFVVAQFDMEEFDLGDEYVPGTADDKASVFTSKWGGYYHVGCSITWGFGVAVAGNMGVWVNNKRRINRGGNVTGDYPSWHAGSLLRLEMGDKVICAVGTSVSAPLLTGDSSTTFFEAIRLSPLKPLSDSDGGS